MFKINNKDTRTTPLYPLKTNRKVFGSFQGIERRRFGVFIVKFEHISHLVLVFLLTLSM